MNTRIDQSLYSPTHGLFVVMTTLGTIFRGSFVSSLDEQIVSITVNMQESVAAPDIICKYK
jgi:hypothetical protein